MHSNRNPCAYLATWFVPEPSLSVFVPPEDLLAEHTVADTGRDSMGK